MLNNINISFKIENKKFNILFKLKNLSSKQQFNKIFTVFLARINTIFNETQFFEIQKYTHVRKLINARLKKKR